MFEMLTNIVNSDQLYNDIANIVSAPIGSVVCTHVRAHNPAQPVLCSALVSFVVGHKKSHTTQSEAAPSFHRTAELSKSAEACK